MSRSSNFLSLLLLVLVALLFGVVPATHHRHHHLVHAANIDVTLNNNSDTPIACNDINDVYFLSGSATKTTIYCQTENTAGCLLKGIIFQYSVLDQATVRLSGCTVGTTGVTVFDKGGTQSTLTNSQVTVQNVFSQHRIDFDWQVQTDSTYLFANTKVVSVVAQDPNADGGISVSANETCTNVKMTVKRCNVTAKNIRGIVFRVGQMHRGGSFIVEDSFVKVESDIGIGLTGKNSSNYAGHARIASNDITVKGIESRNNGIMVQFDAGGPDPFPNASTTATNAADHVGVELWNNTVVLVSTTKLCIGALLGVGEGQGSNNQDMLTPYRCPVAQGGALLVHNNSFTITAGMAAGIVFLPLEPRGGYGAALGGVTVDDNEITISSSTRSVGVNVTVCSARREARGENEMRVLHPAPAAEDGGDFFFGPNRTSNNITAQRNNITMSTLDFATVSIGFALILGDDAVVDRVLTFDNTIGITVEKGSAVGAIPFLVGALWNSTVTLIEIHNSTFTATLSKALDDVQLLAVAFYDHSVFSALEIPTASSAATSAALVSPAINDVTIRNLKATVDAKDSYHRACPVAGLVANVTFAGEFIVDASEIKITGWGTSTHGHFHCVPANHGVMLLRPLGVNQTSAYLQRSFAPPLRSGPGLLSEGEDGSAAASLVSAYGAAGFSFVVHSSLITVAYCGAATEMPCAAVAIHGDSVGLMPPESLPRRKEENAGFPVPLGRFVFAGYECKAQVRSDRVALDADPYDAVGIFISTRRMPYRFGNDALYMHWLHKAILITGPATGVAVISVGNATGNRRQIGIDISDTANRTREELFGKADPTAAEVAEIELLREEEPFYPPPVINSTYFQQLWVSVYHYDASKTICTHLDSETGLPLPESALPASTTTTARPPALVNYGFRFRNVSAPGWAWTIEKYVNARIYIDKISCWFPEHLFFAVGFSVEIDVAATPKEHVWWNTKDPVNPNGRTISYKGVGTQIVLRLYFDQYGDPSRRSHQHPAAAIGHGFRILTNVANVANITDNSTPVSVHAYLATINVDINTTEFAPNMTATATDPLLTTAPRAKNTKGVPYIAAPFYRQMENFSACVVFFGSATAAVRNKTAGKGGEVINYLAYARLHFGSGANLNCVAQKCFGSLTAGALNFTTVLAGSNYPYRSRLRSLAIIATKGSAAGFFFGGRFVCWGLGREWTEWNTIRSGIIHFMRTSNFNKEYRVTSLHGCARGITILEGDTNRTELWVRVVPRRMIYMVQYNTADVPMYLVVRGAVNVTGFEVNGADLFEQSPDLFAPLAPTPMRESRTKVWSLTTADRLLSDYGVIVQLEDVQINVSVHYSPVAAAAAAMNQSTDLSEANFQQPQFANNSNNHIVGFVAGAIDDGLHCLILNFENVTVHVSTTMQMPEEEFRSYYSEPALFDRPFGQAGGADSVLVDVGSAAAIAAELPEINTDFGQDMIRGTLPEGPILPFQKDAHILLYRCHVHVDVAASGVVRGMSFAGLVGGAPNNTAFNFFWPENIIHVNLLLPPAASHQQQQQQNNNDNIIFVQPRETTGLLLSGSSDRFNRRHKYDLCRPFSTITVNSTAHANVSAVTVEATDRSSVADATRTYNWLKQCTLEVSYQACGPLVPLSLGNLVSAGYKTHVVDTTIAVNPWYGPQSEESCKDSRATSQEEGVSADQITMLTVPQLNKGNHLDVNGFVATMDLRSSSSSSSESHLLVNGIIRTLGRLSLLNTSGPIIPDPSMPSTAEKSWFNLSHPVLDTIPPQSHADLYTRVHLFKNISRLFADKLRVQNPTANTSYLIQIACPKVAGVAVRRSTIELAYLAADIPRQESNGQRVNIEQCTSTVSLSKSKTQSAPTESKTATLSRTATSLTTSLTVTPPPTPTHTATRTKTKTASLTPPPTPTSTVTLTRTATPSKTLPPTPSPTLSRSRSLTFSLSRSIGSPSETASPNVTATKSVTPISLTRSPSRSRSRSESRSASRTTTPSPALTPSAALSESRTDGTMSLSESFDNSISPPVTESRDSATMSNSDSRGSGSNTKHYNSSTRTPTRPPTPTHAESLSRSALTRSDSGSGPGPTLTPEHTLTGTESATHWDPPVIVEEVASSEESTLAIIGSLASLAGPTASLEAARQIGTVELLGCGGAEGNEVFDTTKRVKFPLSLWPGVGWGDTHGYYLRGAVLSYFVGFILPLSLLVYGWGEWEARRYLKRSANAKFALWYSKKASLRDKFRLRLFFCRSPSSHMMILIVPIAQLFIALGTVLAAPDMPAHEGFLAFCVIAVYFALIVHEHRSMSAWVKDAPAVPGKPPGAGSLFMMESHFYQNENVSDFAKKVCGWLQTGWGRWWIIGRHFWKDETNLAEQFPREMPEKAGSEEMREMLRQQAVLGILGVEEAEQQQRQAEEEEESPQAPRARDFVYAFLPRPTAMRLGLTLEKFRGPSMNEEPRRDGCSAGKGEIRSVRNWGIQRLQQNWGWRQWIWMSCSALANCILIGIARVRPQFCVGASIMCAVINVVQFIFTLLVQPYVVESRNVNAVIFIEAPTMVGSILAAAYLGSQDKETRADLLAISKGCTMIGAGGAFFALLHFFARRGALLITKLQMKSKMELFEILSGRMEKVYREAAKRKKMMQAGGGGGGEEDASSPMMSHPTGSLGVTHQQDLTLGTKFDVQPTAADIFTSEAARKSLMREAQQQGEQYSQQQHQFEQLADGEFDEMMEAANKKMDARKKQQSSPSSFFGSVARAVLGDETGEFGYDDDDDGPSIPPRRVRDPTAPNRPRVEVSPKHLIAAEGRAAAAAQRAAAAAAAGSGGEGSSEGELRASRSITDYLPGRQPLPAHLERLLNMSPVARPQSLGNAHKKSSLSSLAPPPQPRQPRLVDEPVQPLPRPRFDHGHDGFNNDDDGDDAVYQGPSEQEFGVVVDDPEMRKYLELTQNEFDSL